MVAHIRKAVIAFVVAFVGALLDGARAGTVWSGNGVNWAAVGVALGVAVAAAAAVWAVPNGARPRVRPAPRPDL
jgi:hypothetical protein